MKTIKRKYLDDLVSLIGTPDIKIITGVRRSGKSELLRQFEEYIKENVENSNIISINYSLVENEPLLEYHNLIDYVKEKTLPKKHNFLLIDEVQMCDGFEKALNNFHALGTYDIYVTGSNAFLLGNDLATLFTGRDFPIEVFPFSFSEYLEYHELTDVEKALDKYVTDGGMSGSYLLADSGKKMAYIANIYRALILRDVKQKYNVRQGELLDRVSVFLMDNISNVTSGRKITDALVKAGDEITNKTVNSYIEYLCNAFLFYRVRRYDVQGKKYLDSLNKYYLVDPAFKYAELGTKNMNYGRIYENLVAIELLRRGYEIYSGQLYEREVDFVAIRHSEKIYIQVSDNITDETTFEREISPLLKIKDAYPKLIIARTRHDEYQYEGIKIFNLADWLSGKTNF